MKRVYILPALAALGFAITLVATIHDNAPQTANTQAIVPLHSPYAATVSGAGIVEASTGNITIGTPVSGIVTTLYVKVGDQVNAGDALFMIDDRGLQAQIITAKARINEASAALQKPLHRLQHAEQLAKTDRNAISAQDLGDRRDDAAQAEAALTLAKAQLTQLQMDLERHTVRAPVNGNILQLKMRLGEYVEGSGVTPALLLLGDSTQMNLRVDVDEYDAWRIHPGAAAVAFVRGHPERPLTLQYAYTEPYMVPKTALTGVSTERTDTRVLQVIYRLTAPNIAIYAGQQLDVFIQATDSDAAKEGS